MDESFLESNKSKKKKTNLRQYASHITTTVKWIYGTAIILWILLILFFCFNKTSYFGYIILALPVIIYIIGFINASGVNVESDDTIYACNYLSIGLLVVLPLLTWLDKKENANKIAIIEAMIIAIILCMLSLIDVWVKPQWVAVVRHIKSVFQTASLALLIYALYMFYVGRQ